MENQKALEWFGQRDKKSLLAGIVYGQGMKGRARAAQNYSPAPAGFPQDLWDAANERANAAIASVSATNASDRTPGTPENWTFDREGFQFGVAAGRVLEGWEIDGATNLGGYGKIMLYIHLDEPDELILKHFDTNGFYSDNRVYVDFGDGESYASRFLLDYAHSFAPGDYIVTIIGINTGKLICGVNGSCVRFASDIHADWNANVKSPYSVYCKGDVVLSKHCFEFSQNLSVVTLNQKHVCVEPGAFFYSEVETVDMSAAENIDIDALAFCGCDNLKTIIFPDSVISGNIGINAFRFCNSLTDIKVPEGITRIPMDVFVDCENLRAVTIPSTVSVISVRGNNFVGLPKLTRIIVCEENPIYASVDGVLFSKDMTELICVPQNAGQFKIPTSVRHIYSYAFYACLNLADIIIPSSVVSIEWNAFSSCRLNSIFIPTSVAEIPALFGGSGNLGHLYYAGSKAQWTEAYRGGWDSTLSRAAIHYNSAEP